MQSAQGVDAIHVGHAEIKQHHVGRFVRQKFQRFAAAMRSADNPEAALFAQHAVESRAHHRMVVHKQYADRRYRLFSHSHCSLPHSAVIFS